MKLSNVFSFVKTGIGLGKKLVNGLLRREGTRRILRTLVGLKYWGRPMMINPTDICEHLDEPMVLVKMKKRTTGKVVDMNGYAKMPLSKAYNLEMAGLCDIVPFVKEEVYK